MPVFVDTNVFVHARDLADAAKQERAAAWLELLWRSRAGRLSVQVLEEYYVTVTEKLKPGLDRETARRDVRDLVAWRPLPLEPRILEAAWTIQDRDRISWWDALIVAAASTAGCRTLLTEDLNDGQRFDALLVVNPFRRAPADLA